MAALHLEQGELFAPEIRLPEGFEYRAGFITLAEERSLLDHIGALSLHEALYKGYVAKRRIASFGSGYDFDRNALQPAPPIPEVLLALRERVAQWLGAPAQRLSHALVTEYRPGTTLGWHRDVPQFELVAGISLGASCRMRFRPYPPGRADGEPFAVELEPRSAYMLRGEARWRWQHQIPPTRALRHSITFRSLR